MGWGDMGNLITEMRSKFDAILEISRKTCYGIMRVSRVLEQEYGVPAFHDETRVQPRNLSRVPLIIENTTVAGGEADINLEEKNQGVVPSGGYYTNLGADEFKVVLVGLDDSATIEHTVPPGVSIAITCYVKRINIRALPGKTARYQINAR